MTVQRCKAPNKRRKIERAPTQRDHQTEQCHVSRANIQACYFSKNNQLFKFSFFLFLGPVLKAIPLSLVILSAVKLELPVFRTPCLAPIARELVAVEYIPPAQMLHGSNSACSSTRTLAAAKDFPVILMVLPRLVNDDLVSRHVDICLDRATDHSRGRRRSHANETPHD